jgi:hypothetical protein
MKVTSKIFLWVQYGLANMLLLSATTGCELVDQIQQIMPQPKIELTMQVQSSEPGTFILSGRTNLPDQTNLTLQAVRSLKPTARILNQQPIDSVLAHSQVSIQNGYWQAQIRLHQISPDGRSLEPWQIEPKNRTIDLQPGAAQVSFASDGKSFLKVEESLTLAPPGSASVAKLDDR